METISYTFQISFTDILCWLYARLWFVQTIDIYIWIQTDHNSCGVSPFALSITYLPIF